MRLIVIQYLDLVPYKAKTSAMERVAGLLIRHLIVPSLTVREGRYEKEREYVCVYVKEKRDREQEMGEQGPICALSRKKCLGKQFVHTKKQNLVQREASSDQSKFGVFF